MKAFLVSAVVVVVLAVLASFVLDTRFQHTSAEAYTLSGVRLAEPGDNLVDWQ